MRFFNIKTKLFLVLLIVSIVPIIVVTFSSYRSYTELVNKQTSLVAATTIGNAVESIEAVLQNIERISITFQQQSSSSTEYRTVSDELKQLQATNDSFEIYTIRNKLKLIFQNVLLGYDYINGIYLFTPDGKFISYGSASDLKADYNPLQDSWYQKTLAKQGELYISDNTIKPYFINAKPSISFSRAVYDINTGQFLGVFMLDCSLDIFSGLNRNLAANLSNIYLVNEDGTLLFEGSKNTVGSTLPADLWTKAQNMNGDQAKYYNSDDITVIQAFPSNGWKVIANLSTSKLYKEYGISQKLIIYISATCAVLFVILSIILSVWITRPIIELSRTMRKNKSQKFIPSKVKYKRNDEIGILYTEYDKMMRDIDLYIRESYQNRILTLDSQMKALEAQINSHFLYNTLESINSIAEIEEVESIATMTKALGDMFRYSIKTESELVTASEELQHVDNYMAIQQIRYGDKISFHKTIDERVQGSKILKLILQPLVENALYHGLENKKGKGSITVNGCREGNDLVFEIIDDGIGMTTAQVAEIQALLAEPPEFGGFGQRNKRSIGIKNVHSRIVLYYGPGYGLTFESLEGLGTTVKITIPVN
ncbi:sensor histidine kinase [Paenibacillus sp. P46E]|uniref:sensor histidine kinase n=1 Tax=Paenibacillus sp. P46E TaxID=1349436 RepID=UPI00093B72B4|nr:sensor histidine kinase [Paenibacillus sp. P46E]OKP95168.1 hypothetical protein A3849_27540 [Paenibacillus sp. P46E]